MTEAKLIREIAAVTVALSNCVRTDNWEWHAKHMDVLRNLEGLLPSGSGFDSGCKVDHDASEENTIVINAPYHHMDADGYYCGWVDWAVIVRPCFIGGFSIEVAAVNGELPDDEDFDAEGFCDYVADTFHTALTTEVGDSFTWAI